MKIMKRYEGKFNNGDKCVWLCLYDGEKYYPVTHGYSNYSNKIRCLVEGCFYPSQADAWIRGLKKEGHK